MSAPNGPEASHLEALHAWGILKALPDSTFDELSVLAAHVCDAPFALISLVDEEREQFRSQHGLALTEFPSHTAIAAPAIAARDCVVMQDASSDPRLKLHPLVSSEPNIRFYAAAPLATSSGQMVGALCVMDRTRRDLSEIQRQALLSVSRQVTALLEVKHSVASLRRELIERERAHHAAAGSDTDFRLLAESLPQIVWVRSDEGALYFINRRGLEYSGLSFAQMALQRSPVEAVHPEDQRHFEVVWREAQQEGQSLGTEARLRRHDGVYRWHLIRAHPVRDSRGKVIKWMGTSTDIHDAKEGNERNLFLLDLATELSNLRHPQDLVCSAMLRLRDRLNASKVTLAEIDSASDEAIVLTQSDGGEARLEVTTVPVDSLRHLAVEAKHGLITVLCDTRTDNRSAHVYQSWYKPRGARSMIAVPLLRGGELVALLSVIGAQPRDWTSSEIELVRRVADIVWPALEKSRADRALALSEERLRLAHGIAHLGAWEWDPATNHCVFSPEAYDLFGLAPDEPHNLDELLARVDPRDALAVQAALESCRHISGATEIEYRYHHAARGLRWIHAKAGFAYHAGRPCVVGIGLDVTERRQAEDALKEVNQRKDEFLAMLAHELRNPLAPIRNAAQILRAHGKTHPQLDWARSVIERQARHLTRLVDDLLDVSRIVRGQIALERSVLDVCDVIEQALETSRPLIRERGHELDVQMPAVPIHIEGDLTRLAQVVANLLINAAKYTNEGGRIRVQGSLEDSNAVIRVRDTGIGISNALLPRIFDLFTQGERTLDRAQGGLGIGLTLVRRIVDMHGGSVEASSGGLGQGSEFTVRLLAVERPTTRETSEIMAEPLPVAQQLKILVVDDNVDAADSIAMLLSLDGHEVRSVHDPHQALDLANEFKPDVVLLDIGLPGMDGYEVARRLRSRQEVTRMRLVAVTGYGQQEDRDRARDAGFDQHLVKPVELDALNAVLGTVQAAKH